MSASCVVCGCTNHLYRKVTADLFRFPSKVLSPEKRAAWVAAVRRVHPGGSLWEPSGDCQICSAHFITGQPSCFKDHPDFVPSVFKYARAPGESAVHLQDPCVERHEGKYCPCPALPNCLRQEDDELTIKRVHHLLRLAVCGNLGLSHKSDMNPPLRKSLAPIALFFWPRD
ncbi:unnamed protein product [Ixodes persulcatus]